MMKLGINFNPFAHYISTYTPNSFNLIHLILESEAKNIDAIQLYYGKDFPYLDQNLLNSILSLSKKFVNICIPIGSPDLGDVIKLNPDMITFCNRLEPDSFEIEPIHSEELPSDFSETIERLKNKGILSSVACNPIVKDVKDIAKFEVDYLNFDVTHIHLSENRNEELAAFEKFEMAMVAAEKFGFGISVYGAFTIFNANEYKIHENIEEIYTGKHLFERSMQVGLRNSIQEYTQLLKNI